MKKTKSLTGALILGIGLALGVGMAFAQESHELFPSLTAQWWQFAISIPTTVNPLVDSTGADCVVGFPEAQQKLSWEIRDALDAFECEGYAVTTPAGNKLLPSEIAACIAIIKGGEAVDWMSAKRELPLASAVALAWKDKQIVGVGAIKRERREYAADIAAKSGVDFPPETLELGYVAVAPEHRGHHLSDCIVKALLKQHRGQLFATTYSEYMKDTLIRADFRSGGKEWKGRKFMLAFWLREE